VNVFFEESGSFKAGTVLSKQGDAFQVELPGGRRAKVRGKEVLLEFEAPTPAELIQQADAEARDIDPEFLWECAPADEFPFGVLADEYFGAKPNAIKQAALLLRMHGSPVYFRKKGRGQYQRAPEEQLRAALAGLERKRQQALVQEGYENELKAHRLPESFAGKVIGLLTKPDKNSIEYKALEAAAFALGTSPARLMLDAGGVASARVLHEARFLSEHFPYGTGFAPVTIEPRLDDLPVGDVEAFSIDDVTTTEIDDAFSVTVLPDGRIRIGIHIAAPALGIQPGDAVDQIARSRLSTVYMPGDKITMLPDPVVDVFTLKEGGLRPALSLYLIVDASTYEVIATETHAEKVFVRSNLRHNHLDALVTEETLDAGTGEYPHKAEIALLWPLSKVLYEKRQQTRIGFGLKREVQRNNDFNFYIDGEHVTITPRRRGSPLDSIVAELAIVANSTWGALLADYGVPGIYRAQRSFGPNRTRMQTTPAPHEGLGVAQYAWSTSPLRRYVDLVNQWQLLACAQHGVAGKLVAPFKPKDAELYAVLQGFDETYAAYADYQNKMEAFWCLRWLKQEKRDRVVASVIKGDLVRLEEIPLVLHVPGLGVHPRGTRVLLDVVSIDELTVEASTRLIQVLDAPVASDVADTDEGDEEGEDDQAAKAEGEADRYVVVGNPVAHSKSPWIHARFAEQTGERIAYDPLLAPVDGFDEAVRAFISAGGRGLNVTVPFKLEAFRFADVHSTRAAAAGAVNTLKVDADGTVFGDNTDGIGLVNDIERNLQVSLAGKRVLLLGAGGAARGVALPLLEAGVRELVIVNRTASKAVDLASAITALQVAGSETQAPDADAVNPIDSAAPAIAKDEANASPATIVGGGAEVATGTFDVVINATAGSLGGELPSFDPEALTPDTLAYDMMYAAHPTVFMELAQSRGARAADGLGMLVEQAAESFHLWRGVRPDSGSVLAELRAMLARQEDAPPAPEGATAMAASPAP
jgi:exoribonuclease-2